MLKKRKITQKEHQSRHHLQFPLGSYHRGEIIKHTHRLATVLLEGAEDRAEGTPLPKGILLASTCTGVLSLMPIGFTGNFQVVGYRGGKGHPTLAMRPFADSTWATLTASMYVGQTHRAIIKRFTDDGAAVVYLTSKIQARLEYKKELDTLSEGDEVNVRLTFIDSMRQRIGVVLEDTTHAAP